MNKDTATKPKPAEREFIAEYMSNGNNASAAVRKVYNIEEPYAHTKAGRLMKKPRIKNEIERIADSLGFTAEKAVNNVIQIANSAKNENTRLNANIRLLEATNLIKPPTTRHEIQSKAVIIHVDQALSALREAKAGRKDEK